MKGRHVLVSAVAALGLLSLDFNFVARLDECYTRGNRRPDLDGSKRSSEDSSAGCQLRCQHTPDCSFFTFWPDGGCHLQGSFATEVEMITVITGPRVCGELATGNATHTHTNVEVGVNATLRNAVDLWMVDGMYYDLGTLQASHPGGKLPIMETRGTDVSVLFQIQHLSDRPRAALQRYAVSSDLVIGSIPKESHNYSFETDGFYMSLRERVRSHLNQAGAISPRQPNMGYVIKTAFNMLVFAGSWYRILFYPFCPITCLVNMGARVVLTGIAHEAIHTNLFPKSPNLERCFTRIFFDGMIGFDSDRWHEEHVVYHHPHTKTDIDPDENLRQGLWFWRLTSNTPWRPEHTWPLTSHILVGLFLPTLNWMDQRGSSLFSGFAISRADSAFALVCLLLLHWAPIFFKPNKHGILAVVLCSSLVSLLTLHAFHVSHLQSVHENVFSQDRVDWAEHQMHTTSNWDAGKYSPSGGLDLQIEHHLFPMLSKDKQYAVQPIVRQTARDFGVPYNEFDSFQSALYHHLAHMADLGVGPDRSDCIDGRHTDMSLTGLEAEMNLSSKACSSVSG